MPERRELKAIAENQGGLRGSQNSASTCKKEGDTGELSPLPLVSMQSWDLTYTGEQGKAAPPVSRGKKLLST